MLRKYILCVLLVYSISIYGTLSIVSTPPEKCPAPVSPNNPNVPQCPTSGTQLLNDKYPAAAIVFSSAMQGTEYQNTLIEKIIRAQPDNPPLIIMGYDNNQWYETGQPIGQVHIDTDRENELHFFRVGQTNKRALLTQLAQEILPEDQRTSAVNMWMERIQIYSGSSASDANWSQDFFEYTFNPQTGRPVIRPNGIYLNSPRSPKLKIEMEGITNFANACDISTGPDYIPNELKDLLGPNLGLIENPTSGGNIEGGPLGTCLIGDGHFEAQLGPLGGVVAWQLLAQSLCGHLNNAVKVPTQFLSVGHADEVVKIIPTSGEEPCNFAVLVASPDKALELLGSHPGQKIANDIVNPNTAQGGSRLCGQIQTKRINRSLPQSQPDRSNGVTKMMDILYQIQKIQIGPSTAMADYQKTSLARNATSPLPSRATIDDCKDATAKEILDVAHNDFSKTMNQRIQTELNLFKNQLRERLTSINESCNLQFIDVPVLYNFRDHVEQLSDPRQQWLYAQALATFPTPTNSITIGETVIFSDPGVPAFRNYLDQQLNMLGLKSDYIETPIAHANLGNLHCSTNVIRYCRPSGAKE